jgi:hypothetical protein
VGGQIAFAAFGCTFGVEATDFTLIDRLPDYLPYGWRPVHQANLDREYGVTHEQERDQSLVYSIHSDDAIVFKGAIDEAMDALERDIRLYLVDHAPDLVFVHAGVVGWRGHAIVVPAKSGAGKSSLTIELVRAGAEYYSDEFAVLDSNGMVHPFATHFQVRSRPDLRQHRRSLREVGGVAGTAPIPIGLIAAVSHRPNSVDGIESLTPGQGILELLKHVPIGPNPDKTLAFLEKAVEGARIVIGERGEAKPFARYLLNLLDGDLQTP